MVRRFKDHFSTQSGAYARYRPTYPSSLYDYLASLVPRRERAWDCATGNGQVAVALADQFTSIIATDASQSQIDAATQHRRVNYRVAVAEESGLDDASVDLVTVGQALHWFDRGLFMAEVARVLRPGSVLAVWCYELCEVEPQCDSLVQKLYNDIVGEFWPPERRLIERGYRDFDMPGEELACPDFCMTFNWSVESMLGYLRTWSACERYRKASGHDPVLLIEGPLKEAWGNSERWVSWPLKLRVSRSESLLE